MNSVMESLAVGKPMFALPRGADQFINAQHVSGTELWIEVINLCSSI
jgi:UDP:flavonoid glycosyltransferase YjiC (YdhE family)